MIMAKLIFDDKEYEFQDYATIGRASKCTLSISDIKLSRIHCEIIRDENDYILIDLKSQNGVQLNSSFVTEAFLKDYDQLTLGKSEVLFRR